MTQRPVDASAPCERDTYGVICKGADTLTTLADGFCFGEGPRWFEGLLWFSDMLGEAVHTVNLQGRGDHPVAAAATNRPGWAFGPTAHC